MCIAIYKPKGTKPMWQEYRNGHDANPHGWGFAVIHNGRLVVRHGYNSDKQKSFKAFRRAFGKFGGCQAIIHFRWATHGEHSTSNCHPFEITDQLAMIHNGVISIKCDIDAKRSDTWHYVQHILRPLHGENERFYLASHHRYNAERSQSGSKFVFLHADGSYGIWNEGSGVWKHGHWWSNTRFECTPCYLAPAKSKSKSYTATATSSSSRYGGYSYDYAVEKYRRKPYSYKPMSAKAALADRKTDSDQLALNWQGDAKEPDVVTDEDIEFSYEDDGTAVCSVATSSIHSTPASNNLLIVERPALALPVTRSVNSSLSTLHTQAEYISEAMTDNGVDPATCDDLIACLGTEAFITMGLSIDLHK